MKTFKTLPFQVSQKIVDLSIIQDATTKRHEEESRQAHKILWDAVHSEYPELDQDANYMLKCEFSKQGIVMLVSRDSSKDQVPNLIKQLLTRFK